MAAAKRDWTERVYSAFYWIAVATALGCFTLILAGNSELVSRFEHRAFPLSWAFAGVAILACLAAEFCHYAFSLPHEAEEPISQLTPELEAAEL